MERIPAKEVQYRVFTLGYQQNAELARAAEQALQQDLPSTPTNL